MSGGALRVVEEVMGAVRGEAGAVSEIARGEIQALESAGARLPSSVAEGEGIAAAGSQGEARVIEQGLQDAQGELNQAARPAENAAAGEARAAAGEGAGNVRAQMDRVAEPVGWGTSLKNFALKCGIEIGKGALMAAGMEGLSAAWRAIEKNIEEKKADAAKSKRSEKLDKFVTAWKELQAIKDEWSKWMLSRYNLKETYGSVTITQPTHFTILNYITVQGQIDAATNYATKTVSKAIDIAKAAQTAEGMEKANAVLLMCGNKMADLMDAANTTIKDQAKMLAGGLKDHGTDIAASKKKMTDAYTDDDKKLAALANLQDDSGVMTS